MSMQIHPAAPAAPPAEAAHGGGEPEVTRSGSLSFLGAAGTVTGSKYLLGFGGKQILVDCGLFQGLKQLRLRNREPFAVHPSEIDAVVLTHAHLDHSGYLPALVRDGFAGPIYCTPPTADLCAVLLRDSGHLQEEEARNAAKYGYSKHSPPLPLYTEADAEAALGAFRTVGFGEAVQLGAGLGFEYARAGHMLGAAFVTMTTPQGSLLFSGDLGRPNDPMLPAPDPPGQADRVVVESTYGDRRHHPVDPADQLAGVIRRTVERGGSVIVPAFAVGRAQSILLHLHQLRQAGRIPDIPAFLDSPMAQAATTAYRAHARELRLTPHELSAVCSAAEPVSSPRESRRIDHMRYPRIIIAASGMATGGRVLHHLKALGGDPRNTIAFAGYQAAGTRGAALVAGEREIKIHGAYVTIRAEVTSLDSLSGHADYAEILGWLGRIPNTPREVFVTHGEPVAADAMRRHIEERLGWSCTVPEHLQTSSF